MIRFLEDSSTRLSRCARVQIIIQDDRKANNLYELIVDLDQGIVLEQHLLEGKHSYIDAAYMKAVENVCISNADVQKEIELLELPAEATVTVEPWAYATDGMNNMAERTSMVCALSQYLLTP